VGRTVIGRATVTLLAVNHPDYVHLRESLIAEGTFPPSCANQHLRCKRPSSVGRGRSVQVGRETRV
jgi:hypothetical protein